MQSYQVLGGKHFEKGMTGKITRYEKGDVVKSLRDLKKLFPNKFELVESEAKEPPEVTLKIESLGKGQYNVFNTLTRKNLNEDPLTKSEAEKLVNEHEGD